MDRMNVVIVITDTLRTAYLGCYGNPEIHTPHLDAFARQGTRFTRAYPESLPTIPVRRALHTGRRAYPFHGYKPIKWGTVYLPGWQPMADEEDTLAESLAVAGYHTGYATTTQHCWNPGYNFERGFWQWEHVRGYSHEDRWASPFTVSRDLLSKYGDPDELMKTPHRGIPMGLANRARALSDEETATARLFQWGARFLEENQVAQPFYLLLDSFAPHEPWEAPEMYYRLYGDPNYSGRRLVRCKYGPADGYTLDEIEYIKAQYSGLVSHVDYWFGVFMNKLDLLGLTDNTAVLFVSDHGTNFCENPRNVIGKPENSMYPGVMHLPFLVRLPGGQGAGQTRDELVYNLDLTATAYDLAGLRSAQGMDGQSLLPLLGGEGMWKRREYVTCRYGHSLCYIDDRSWVLTNVDGESAEVFDLEADPLCTCDIAEVDDSTRFRTAWERLLSDAGGELPDYRGDWLEKLPNYRGVRETDALGRPKRGTRLP
jgi:arylsulfatase A-like enzyme